jgi:hypothetical protein
MGIILRVLRLEVSVNNVYITNQFQTTFAQGSGEHSPLVEVTVNRKERTLKAFVPIVFKNSSSGFIQSS